MRIIEIGSCWRFGPCRFSSYGMYLNIRTNHSLFYQEYISAQVIIPRPHPQHILFPTSHEYLLSLALEWMIKFSPGLKNIYTIPQVLLVNKYYKLNSFFWSFFLMSFLDLFRQAKPIVKPYIAVVTGENIMNKPSFHFEGLFQYYSNPSFSR